MLRCTATASREVELSITWTGPGRNAVTSDDQIPISPVSDNNTFVYTNSIQFTYLTENDNNSRYTCEVMGLGVSQYHVLVLRIQSSKLG